MAIAPRFMKYRTRSGNYYVYDPGTNEIVRIGALIYRIVDDFGVLDADELIEKYRSFGEVRVRHALAQLASLQARGILCDSAPHPLVKAERIRCQGKEESLEEFLRSRRRLLTLELTQQCNLRCDYCCYGKHYPQVRKHDQCTMSLETAKRVVSDYLDHEPQPGGIGFYGGEPLLEFELMRQIVSFAEEYADKRGVTPEFNITTNGTLLTDEKIHFLVQHGFSVIVSLDGPKEVHDRYRVFRNERDADRRIGSYDVVMRNIERFIELYPEYVRRGFSVTVTATADPNAIDDLLRRLRPFFPVILQNSVRDVPQVSEKDAAFQMGACCPPPVRQRRLS